MPHYEDSGGGGRGCGLAEDSCREGKGGGEGGRSHAAACADAADAADAETEDPYKEDVSWIRNTEKRFRDEERLREKQIEAAKREEQRYNKLKLRFRRQGNKRPLPAKKTFVIPPSAFPEFHPKPKKTEAEREAEREAAKREEERRQEEEEALRREVVSCRSSPVTIQVPSHSP